MLAQASRGCPSGLADPSSSAPAVADQTLPHGLSRHPLLAASHVEGPWPSHWTTQGSRPRPERDLRVPTLGPAA